MSHVRSILIILAVITLAAIFAWQARAATSRRVAKPSQACTLEGALDIAVCDPGAGPFSLTIDNSYYPLAVGDVRTYDGRDGSTAIHLVISVLNETEAVAGVTTRVIEERESEDGELIEVSRNFFAQAPNGSVCYYGEDVDIYEGGKITGHGGAWRAGGGNRPGIVMPPNPKVGMTFAQENAPGVAEDQATIAAAGESITVPAGTFTDTLRTTECTPLEPGVTESKSYARNVGLIIDAVVRLTSGPRPHPQLPAAKVYLPMARRNS